MPNSGARRLIKESVMDVAIMLRAIFTYGPQGPGPRAANFQGRHIKKIEIEVWYAGKKRLSL
jgi:hypothetical protein